MCRSLNEVDRVTSEADDAGPEEASAKGRGRTWSQETTASGSTLPRADSENSLSRQSSPSDEFEPPPKHDTCIIFDWDDTLLCTSFLNLSNGELGPSEECHLRSIERAVVQLLEASQRVAHTFIVTNSVSGWVDYSAREYLPAVAPLLESVPIISARDRFEGKFPDDWNRWKTEAFLDLERELDPEVTRNVIALGDNVVEIDAAHALGGALDAAAGRCDGSGRHAPGVHVKTVKFRERPTPEELLKQLELVLQKFDKIVDTQKGLKIGLERKWVGNAQSPKTSH